MPFQKKSWSKIFWKIIINKTLLLFLVHCLFSDCTGWQDPKGDIFVQKSSIESLRVIQIISVDMFLKKKPNTCQKIIMAVKTTYLKIR
jgi:hypothetical protein